jgi:hypothetical protein
VDRDEFRDALRRAASITGDRDLIIVGSQSIHGAFNKALLPRDSTVSGEVDVIALNDQDGEKEWALSGRGFVYGIEIDGVDIGTSTLPEGWMERLIPYPLTDDPEGVIGWCLDPHDLAVAKAVAGREKDARFLRALAHAGLIDPHEVLRRLAVLDGRTYTPRQPQVDAAAALLASMPQPPLIYRPATRPVPKGRRRPTYDDLIGRAR